MRLITLFRQQPELRLSIVREHPGAGQSTAHRLMAMFVYRGFAAQDPKTRVYRAGPALFEVGLAVVHNFDLRTVGRPIMEALAEQYGETVHLGTLEGPACATSTVSRADRHSGWGAAWGSWVPPTR